MKAVVCIPARYASTRFPAKVLAKKTGKYLIQHVYEQARKAELVQRVIIAADDERIAAAAREFGAECILTSPEHRSGTDRIAEAIAGVDAEIVVNVQADEPEIDPGHIDRLVQLLLDHPEYPMATLAVPFASADQVADPNIVKVVVAIADCGPGSESGVTTLRIADSGRSGPPRSGHAAKAVYFSRSVIPYDREKGGIGSVSQYLRHIGIYAYRRDFLLKITSLPQTPLEKIEKLEQLRVVEHGFGILVGIVEHTQDGIDTPEQYAEFVRRQAGRV